MLHPSKARLASPAAVAAWSRRRLKALSHPAEAFDASRYFRGSPALGFYNVGTPAVRHLAAEIVRDQAANWTADDALEFADLLIEDRFLEAKQLAVEVVARYRRAWAPRMLFHWKRWLADDHAANWATTDAICGMLIGPLLTAHPALIDRTRAWVRHRNVWVRRAAAVGLVGLARRGQRLDDAYAVAEALHSNAEDLIQKAVGWLLREAGKTNPPRLERYLLAHGPSIPRTTVRYAIERCPAARRRELLELTKAKGTRQAADAARRRS